MTSDQSAAMAHTYVNGPFATIIGAGSTDMLMNLGWAPDPERSLTVAQRQVCLADRVLSQLRPQAGQVIADIGCGKGGLTRHIIRHHPEVRVIGLNVDRAQLTVARAADACLGARPGYVVGSAERLPLRAGSVDAALVVELLSHLADKAAFWTEISRVMRPGGRLVIAAITIRRPLGSFDTVTRAHLARLAGYFAERAEDLPQAADIRAELERRGWAVLDEDLSAGVYGPRDSDMRTVLRGLDSPDAHVRDAARAAVRSKWAADPDMLADYLRTCTSTHALRYYEYHLFKAVAS